MPNPPKPYRQKSVRTMGIQRRVLFIKNTEFQTAWTTGSLPGCTHYKVMCKIIKSLLWNITSKGRVINFIKYWHGLHKQKFEYRVFDRALEWVYVHIQPDLRKKWASERRIYRAKMKLKQAETNERKRIIAILQGKNAN